MSHAGPNPASVVFPVSVQVLDVLASLFATASVKVSKLLVQVFASIYPLVFRYLSVP